jgi:hypothetical protein
MSKQTYNLKMYALVVSSAVVLLVGYLSIHDHHQQTYAQIVDKGNISQPATSENATATTSENATATTSENATATTSENASKPYYNSTYGVSMNYPPNWKVLESGESRIDSIAYFQPANLTNNTLPTFVGLVVQPNPKNLTLPQYASEVNRTLSNSTEQLGIRSLTIGDTDISGAPAKEIIYEATDNSGNLTANMNIATIRDNLVYLLVFSADPDNYAKYRHDVEDMKDSLRLQQSNDTSILE